MTHDYKRHGTTTLFAALNVLTGEVIGQCHGRHRHQEFLKFLRHLDRAFPPDLTLHVTLDNYSSVPGITPLDSRGYGDLH